MINCELILIFCIKFEKNLLLNFNGKLLYKEKKLSTKIGIAFLFSFVLSFSMICCKKAFAESPFSFGYHHKIGGFVYTNTMVPEFLPKAPHLKPMNSNNMVNVSYRKALDDEDEDDKNIYAGLKKGESSSVNIMGLVEMGNAGLLEAVKNGNISKIYFVDSKKERLWAYYFFYEKLTTIVYGE